jgi:hypothetical protein
MHGTGLKPRIPVCKRASNIIFSDRVTREIIFITFCMGSVDTCEQWGDLEPRVIVAILIYLNSWFSTDRHVTFIISMESSS